MKRDIYAYLTTAVLIIAIAFSLFLVISDNHIPFTTQATVKTSSIEVVPQVSGYIKKVFVKEGEMVFVGSPLIQIDSSDYEIAKQKADATSLKAQNQWQQTKRHLTRLKTLYKSHSVSKEVLDDAQSSVDNAYSSLLVAQAELTKTQRDIDNSLIVAKHSGMVTNLSFDAGMYVSPTAAVIHLVDDQRLWIAADFTEKGLSALSLNRSVNIVFDAYPNEVYQGHIISIDSAISSGITESNQLAEVTSESRWIRPQQKIRVRIAPDIGPQALIAGSRASVMVRDGKKISDTWMTLLSWMRYFY
jgi:RND family efflux transporter MFP subunit